jgi:hypothetical protein
MCSLRSAAGTPTIRPAAIASTRATTGTATPSPRPGRAAAAPPEIGIDARLPTPVVVAKDAVESAAAQHPAQDTANDLAQGILAAAAECAPRLVIADTAGAVTGAFELAAAAGHVANLGANPRHLAVGLLQLAARGRDRGDSLVVRLSRRAHGIFIQLDASPPGRAFRRADRRHGHERRRLPSPSRAPLRSHATQW